MKYSVQVYSFQKYFNDGTRTPFECIAKAKELGFDAIEFTDRHCESVEEAERFRAEAERVGIEIVSFACSGRILCDGEVETLKGKLDIAKALGCKYLRHDIAHGDVKDTPHHYESFDSLVPRLAEKCREITAYAKTLGIKTMTENHGRFSQDSLRVEKLVSAVADDNFGWLVDIGNFLCADDDPKVAVGRAARYAFYVHAKDFIVKDGNCVDPGEGFFKSRGGAFLRGTIVGHGDVPTLQCMRALKASGYDGYMAVEFEGMEDCDTGVRVGLANLKRFWEMA